MPIHANNTVRKAVKYVKHENTSSHITPLKCKLNSIPSDVTMFGLFVLEIIFL